MNWQYTVIELTENVINMTNWIDQSQIKDRYFYFLPYVSLPLKVKTKKNQI